ncbi:MAG: phosphatidate cytidylyltransferase [Neisseriaceae bacterium]
MLMQRVSTALILLLIVMGILLGSDYRGWLGLTLVLTLLGQWEYSRIVSMNTASKIVYLSVSLGLLLLLFYGDVKRFTMHLSGFDIGMTLSLLCWIVLVPYILKRGIVLKNPLLTLPLGWLMFLPFAYYLGALFFNKTKVGLESLEQVNWLLLYLLLLVWWADTAAYFVGKIWGKHKLVPRISPGKSIEGLIGAIVSVMLYTALYYALLTYHLEQPFRWDRLLVWVLLSIPLTGVSVLGDLLESWLKRCAAVKDSSRLLPGHGGVYDRIDSWISVLAMYPLISYCLQY